MGFLDGISKTVGDLTKSATEVAKTVDDLSKVVSSAVDGVSSLTSNVSDCVSNAVKTVTDSAIEWNDERDRKNEQAKQLEQKKKAHEQAVASGYYEENGHLIVSTAQGMQTYLNDLQDGASPAILPMLQSQLKVLQYVQSPTMTGMAIDNMIAYLHQSLKMANDEETSTGIRNAFAALIQNYMFFTEATLRLAIDKNNNEAKQLLIQAGDMLTDAVQTTAAIVSTAGKKHLGKVIIQNIFSKKDNEENFISGLISWFSDKKIIEEKKKQYLVTIEQLFYVFDQYAELIGPSIQVKGMLMRYRMQLTEKFESEKLAEVKKRSTQIDPQKISQITEGLGALVNPGSIDYNKVGASLGALLGIAADSFNNKADMNVKSFCMIEASLEKRLKKLKEEYQELDSEINRLLELHREIGMFQLSRKKESQEKIDKKKKELETVEGKINKINQKIEEMNELFPEAHAILLEMEEYNNRLCSIENKFNFKIKL